MQYTLRNVPQSLDAALRRRASLEKKSLNEAALEALARGLGHGGERVKMRDLGEIAGSWCRDAEVEDALDAQRTIDEALWK